VELYDICQKAFSEHPDMEVIIFPSYDTFPLYGAETLLKKVGKTTRIGEKAIMLSAITFCYRNGDVKQYDDFAAISKLYGLCVKIIQNASLVGYCPSMILDLSDSPLKDMVNNLFSGSLIDLDNFFDKNSEIKSENEIEIMNKCIEKSSYVIPFVVKCLETKDFTEAQLQNAIDEKIKSLGLKPSFPTIVAYDSNAQSPHYIANPKSHTNPKVVLLDFGGYYKGYSSDISRTFISTHASQETKDDYKSFVEFYNTLLPLYHHNSLISEINKKVKNWYIKNNVKKHPVHGLGHGLGRHVHEKPYMRDSSDKRGLNAGSKAKILKNMVVTLEPGLYHKDYGFRIENDILIGENEGKIMGNCPNMKYSLDDMMFTKKDR